MQNNGLLNNLHSTQKSQTNFDSKNYVFNIIKSLFFSYLLSIIMIIIGAAIFSFTNLNESFIRIFVSVVTMISVTICGFLTCKNIIKGAWIWGSLSGICYVLVLYLMGAFATNNFLINKSLFMLFIVGIFFGIFGGILGINLKPTPQKKQYSKSPYKFQKSL